METVKKFKTLVLFSIITVLVAILFLKGCDNTPADSTIDTEEHFRDSIKFHSTHVDTTYFIDTIPYILEIPVMRPDTITDNKRGTYNLIYNNPIEDSLINGNIYTMTANDGTLVEQKLTYLPLFPKYITIKDSIYLEVKDSVYHTHTKEVNWALSAGAQTNLGVNHYDLSFLLGIENKKKEYIVGYDPFNKTVAVGLKYKFYTHYKKK